jgi:ADP-ribosylglycohydrolase
MGQVIGDSLGSLVEFQPAKKIQGNYPSGVRDLADGGTWNTLAGQPTDDTELALALARTLVQTRQYDDEKVAEAYGRWYGSHPFDIGGTTRMALSAAHRSRKDKEVAARDNANCNSQSNGSLMRISPIGIWARDPKIAALAAEQDSKLSHPNQACVAACASFAAAIAKGMGEKPADLPVQAPTKYELNPQCSAPLTEYSPIRYPAALVKGSECNWVNLHGASSLHYSAARQQRGPCHRARSRWESYRLSVSSGWARLRLNLPGLPLSLSD